MMKKYRLNAVGAQRLQQKLYRGQENVLQEEAHHARSDLIGWTEKWFYLHTTQADYMEAIPVDFMDVLADTISDALLSRTPISLVLPSALPADEDGDEDDDDKPDPPDLGNPGRLLNLSKQTDATYVPKVGYSQTRSLEIRLALPIELEG